MEVYDREWHFMGTRDGLADDIERVTRIDKKYLTGPDSLPKASFATKLNWMAGRVTWLVEDIAYGMLGVLDVSLVSHYGEGRKAFMRLQLALVESSSDESIFDWTVPDTGFKCYRRGDHVPPWELDTGTS